MINETEKIDFLDIDESDTSKLLLIITDHLEWKRIEDEHLFLLQEKLNNYVTYILDGQYRNLYTQDFSSFEIVIYFAHPPKKKCEKLLSFFNSEVKKQFPQLKIDVTYRLLESD